MVSLGLELTTITYNYIRDVRDAPEESKQLYNELNALKDCLESLEEFLRAQATRQIPFSNTSALVVSAKICEDDFKYLRSRLLEFKEVYEKRKWYRRLTWPFKRDEHNKVLRRIKDYTQTFHFSASMEGW